MSIFGKLSPDKVLSFEGYTGRNLSFSRRIGLNHYLFELGDGLFIKLYAIKIQKPLFKFNSIEHLL